MHLLVDPVTGGDLTRAQTDAVLSSPLRTRMGAELLTLNLAPVPGGDLTRVLGSGSCGRDADKVLHADASFTLDREVAWGTTLVRLYATLTGGGVTARSYFGCYLATTPTRRSSAPFDVQALDRLALLDRYLPDTRTVAAGADVLAAITSTLTDAGIDAGTVLLDTTATGKTLPTARTWPLLPQDSGGQGGFTWLNVVNDLLSAIGYRGLYTDELGRFRSGPYLTPGSRQVEWSFAATVEQRRKVLLGADRELTGDTYALPNQWTFYQRNPATGQTPLTYTRTDAAGVAARGGGALGVWPAQPTGLDAVDAASLKAQGDAIADRDLLTSRAITTSTSPFPIAGHADVYALTDPTLGVLGKVSGNSWRQAWTDKGLLADTQHGWRVIT